MKIIPRYLPADCYYAQDMRRVSGCVYHFISAKNTTPDDPFNIDEIIRILAEYKFSAHYLIDRGGEIYQLVPGTRKAKHAGKSRMNGIDWCNGFTIGIEFVGGTDYPYTDEQIRAGAQLTAEIMTNHGFGPDWLKGHDEVRKAWNDEYPDNQGDIKVDPGDHFPWADVREALKSVAKDGELRS